MRRGSLGCFILYEINKHINSVSLFYTSSKLDPLRPGGNRLNDGRSCPPEATMGAIGSVNPELDAAAMEGIGAGAGFALAATTRPKCLGRSLTFHGRTSSVRITSSSVSSRGRLGPRCAGGKTTESNCIKGI